VLFDSNSPRIAETHRDETTFFLKPSGAKDLKDLLHDFLRG